MLQFLVFVLVLHELAAAVQYGIQQPLGACFSRAVKRWRERRADKGKVAV